MLFETSAKLFKHLLSVDPHPFITEKFIEPIKHKVERIVRLVENEKKTSFGLVAGIKDGIINSPFSAPFGGFHFQHNLHYTREIDDFIAKLQSYIANKGLMKIEITLPPEIYHQSMNAKICNSLIRNGFSNNVPEITNWIDLKKFEEEYTYRDSRTYFRQAVKHNLTFHIVTELDQKKRVYNLVKENRERMGRPIYMTFEDLQQMEDLWPVDYFSVLEPDRNMVASAIFYQYHPSIAFAVFWGDSEDGRPLRAMDYLLYNLWTHYKKLGYEYIDLGVSTESGIPNTGLLRFKETHDCTSSLRFSFSWEP